MKAIHGHKLIAAVIVPGWFSAAKPIVFCAAILSLAIFWLIDPVHVNAQEETAQPENVETAQPSKDFPDRIEITPSATVTAARLSAAHAQIQKAETLAPVFRTLDLVEERLEELEKLYNNWEEINNWRLNRLHIVESAYADIREKQKAQLDIIHYQLQIMENLLSTWEKEKVYWQEWQKILSKKQITYSEETFDRILGGIDRLLERVNSVGGELLKAEQKYSPGQVIITRRLMTINKTMDSIRRDIFRRNSFSLFEPGYYGQFNRELFTDFTSSLAATLQSSKGYFKDRGWAAVLQIILILIITQLLINRRKQSRPIAEEWDFLFRRPLTGAIFINIIVVGNFTRLYQNLPLGWRWMLLVMITVVTIRLINLLYQEPREKRDARSWPLSTSSQKAYKPSACRNLFCRSIICCYVLRQSSSAGSISAVDTRRCRNNVFCCILLWASPLSA